MEWKFCSENIRPMLLVACIALVLGFVGGIVSYNVLGHGGGQPDSEHYEEVAIDIADISYQIGNQLYYQFEFKANSDGYVHVQNYKGETDRYVTDLCFHKGNNVLMIPWLNMNYKPLLTFYERV